MVARLKSGRIAAPIFLLTLAIGAGLSASAAAQGQVELDFHSVSGGVSLTGSGTNTAGLSFGSVSAHGTTGPGVSRSNGSSDYTLSTLFGVRVTRKGRGSTYTLRARLLTSHPLTWQVNDIALTTTYQTVAFSQPFDTILSHSLAFVVSHATSAGPLNTTIQVLAIAD
jgi:hypothetical protein